MLDLDLLQAYVNAALQEMNIRNTGKHKVVARFNDKRPGVAWVPVHPETTEHPEDFAEHLAGLCHRAGWSAELDDDEKNIEVTSS